MCEIFFLYSRNGTVNRESLKNLLKAALPAAKRNNDGFGIFNDQKDSFKTKKKLKNGHIPNMVDRFEDSKFVVVHLRLATQGSVCTENAHPFQHNNNLLVHNGGVTPEYSYSQDRADSYDMLRDIMAKREDGETVEAIKDSMQDTSGRVSVFLHDDQHRLYYFRETSKFTFAVNPVTNEYVGATKGRRLHDIWEDDRGQVNFFDNLQTKDPEQNKIYRIDEEDIHEVGEFDMDTYKTAGNNSRTRGAKQTWRSTSKNHQGHPQARGNQTTQHTTSTSEDQENIGSCTVLTEEEIDEDARWSQESYERQKGGMTYEEFHRERNERVAQRRARSEGMHDIYNLEEEIYGLPADDEGMILDEQEYWEQETQRMARELGVDESNFPESDEEEVEMDYVVEEDQATVKDYVDDEEIEAGLKQLFG